MQQQKEKKNEKRKKKDKRMSHKQQIDIILFFLPFSLIVFLNLVKTLYKTGIRAMEKKWKKSGDRRR